MTSRTSRPSTARRIVQLSALALAVALPCAAYLMANAVKGTSSQGWEDFDVFVVGIGVLGITNASVGSIILFSERLRDEVDMGTVTTDLTDTTGSVLAPAFVGIWLRPRGTNR